MDKTHDSNASSISFNVDFVDKDQKKDKGEEGIIYVQHYKDNLPDS